MLQNGRYDTLGNRDNTPGDMPYGELNAHPARFPQQLACDHVLSRTNLGDLIIDPMAGSGTTLRAAADLGRRAIGIEINPEYCQLIRRRMGPVVLPMDSPGYPATLTEPSWGFCGRMGFGPGWGLCLAGVRWRAVFGRSGDSRLGFVAGLARWRAGLNSGNSAWGAIVAGLAGYASIRPKYWTGTPRRHGGRR